MTQEKSLALPESLEEIRGFADAFVKSGMFQDTKQLAQAIVKIQAGRELGLPPVYAMQNINMIRDRLTTSANTMAMLVKKSGKYNYRIKEHTDASCSITFYEDGKESGVSTFTMDDAKRANLVRPDSGWTKFPRAMLFSRAISQGARIYAPDAIGGVYTDEEIRSIPDKPESGSVANGEATEIFKTSYSTTYEEQAKALPATPEPNPAPPVDLTWLKETLDAINWKPATAQQWIAKQLQIQPGKSLTDTVMTLSPEQAKIFVTHITTMREASGR